MILDPVIVALSGGVDSAVAALRLRDEGYPVECLHMTNWEDDGYCDAAAELRDAVRICKQLGLPLHRVNFAREYRDQVFASFLREYEAGRTPNPDVLCNREIKFGVMRQYARRLGARYLATGHYARLGTVAGSPALLKGLDPAKDQSYFLHAVATEDFADVLFPLGALHKEEVRDLAQGARLEVAQKKDSTGICFIGERPFAQFLSQYIGSTPGPIVDPDGNELGHHQGLAFYTLGQRQGLGIGGLPDHDDKPWYVAKKDIERNALIVVQGDHPLLYCNALVARDPHWVGEPPPQLPISRDPGEGGTVPSAKTDLIHTALGMTFRCCAKSRYRQADQPCTVTVHATDIEVTFDTPQRAVTPGQYVVFYQAERCLGGATIEHTISHAARNQAPGRTPAESAMHG